MKCALVFRKPVVENLVTWLACSTPRHTFLFLAGGGGEGDKACAREGSKDEKPRDPSFHIIFGRE